MDLDRGTLARIDRKLLAGLGQCATFQMVRVPVTAAKWSTEERLHGWTEQLRIWEGELQAREQRTRIVSSLALRPADASRKVGRNERCPCRSGLKYKHCHGLAGRSTSQ